MAYHDLHIRRIRRALLRIRSTLTVPALRSHTNPDPAPNSPLHKLGFCKRIHDKAMAVGEFGPG